MKPEVKEAIGRIIEKEEIARRHGDEYVLVSQHDLVLLLREFNIQISQLMDADKTVEMLSKK